MTANEPLAQLPPPTTHEKYVRFRRRLKVGERWEKLYPLLGGLLCALLIWKGNVTKVTFEKLIKDAVPSAIAVAAIFAGFQGAIHAVLLSMLNSRIVRIMRRGQGEPYARLIGFMRSGFGTLILFVAMALGVVVVYDLDLLPDKAIRLVSAACTGLFAWSLLASVRISMIEVQLLKMPDE